MTCNPYFDTLIGVPAAVSKASNEELECLYYYQQLSFPDLIYGVGRQKTFRINGKLRHVDGFSPQEGLIIEYLGCFFHGRVQKMFKRICSKIILFMLLLYRMSKVHKKEGQKFKKTYSRGNLFEHYGKN